MGDEPFAVILGDDVIDANPPALRQMIDVYDRLRGPVLAVERVPMEDVSSYGVVAIDDSADLGRGVYRITDLVEKPRRRRGALESRDHRPLHSDARYFSGARGHLRDRTGEIQLTNGLRQLLQERPIYAWKSTA